jgi:hypothetical protein
VQILKENKMAYVTRSHGDFKQQMNFDTDAYTVGAINAVTDDATVQPQGPKLEFFTITGNGTTSNVGTYANTVISTLTQLCTIHLYEFNTSPTDATLAVGVYPVGAWGTVTATGAGTLDQALTDAVTAAGGTGNVSIAATATFTN